MITMLVPLPIGNAIRLFLEPPSGAQKWRILRKGSDDFSGPDDASALNVYEGDLKVLVDDQYLQNEVMAFYRPYYLVDGDWVAGPTSHSTPVATYEDHSTEVMEILRDRLENGLFEECKRGTFRTRSSTIAVYTAPPSTEVAEFPLVSIHLDSEAPSEDAIGTAILEDYLDPETGEWVESDGWLAQVQLSVVAWSLNPDERRQLRKALRRLVVANLPVFEAHGMQLIRFSAQDVDAVSGEYSAPLYQVMGTFSCLAPTRVASRKPRVNETDVIGIEVNV